MDPWSAILFPVTQQVLNGLISTAIKIIPELLHMFALMQPRLVITQVEFFPNTHNGHHIAYICGTYCVGPIMKMKQIDYMGQVKKLRLSCYLVLLSIDSKTR